MEAEVRQLPYLGLAPFLRLSVAGEDLQPIAQDFLTVAQANPEDSIAWMNLSVALQCVGQQSLGLTIQAQALADQTLFVLPALQQPAVCRVLMLMAPGDVAENTPLDCLLENSDIDLIHYFVIPGAPLPSEVPEHDVLIVAMGDSPRNRAMLAAWAPMLAEWPRPILNLPQYLPLTERSEASRRLQTVPGVLMPTTFSVDRATLSAVAAGQRGLDTIAGELVFPVIVRPVGSQAGRDLAQVETPAALADYLAHVAAPELFVARFIDYSGGDGLFRKTRVAFVDGEPFVCHHAVSPHWMVHYVNAGMYEHAERRAEEAAFMADFAAFKARHAIALRGIAEQLPLDYFCMDCAEMPDGRLMIFEADHVMVVHAMDSADLFPYKAGPMAQVQAAFRALLLRRMGVATEGEA